MKGTSGCFFIFAAVCLALSRQTLATVELEWVGLDEPPSTAVFRSIGVAEAPDTLMSPTMATQWSVDINMDLLAALPEWLE
jgi:hypothetical protein